MPEETKTLAATDEKQPANTAQPSPKERPANAASAQPVSRAVPGQAKADESEQKTAAAGMKRPPEGVTQGQPRPAGQSQPRPAGQGQPRPAGQGQPRPAGQGQPRPAGQGQPRPAGPGQPRPAGPGQPRPAGPGQPRPAGPGQPRPAGPGQPRPAGPGQPRPAGQSQQRPAGQGQQRPAGQGQQRPAGQGQQRPAGQSQQRPAGQGQPPRRRPDGNMPPRPPARPAAAEAVITAPQEIELPASLTVRDMAEMIQRSPIDIIKILMNYGIMAPITHTIEYDVAAIVAEELGIKVKPQAKPEVTDLTATADANGKTKTLRQRLLELTPDERLMARPPVVTVLGHVDHGKTTLLDAIRKTNVVSQESGGITQHIGAYQVDYKGRKITFLDTPGHEAFTAMRARGAQATDIAILVVAADDGVMPQTREAIAHVRAAEVPIIIALNKVDKANANPDRVRQQLADEGLLVESWGGDVISVEVAAKLKRGIDTLLENLLVLAEVEGFKADPDGPAIGSVIEGTMDKARGSTATLLVQKGTLHVGDVMLVGHIAGRMRAMFDSAGNPIEKATPSTPVVVLGLPDVPTAGDTFQVYKDERAAREEAARRVTQEKERADSVQRKSVTLDDVFAQMKAGKVKELRLILKADVDGSLEPIINSLNQLSNDDLRIKLLHTGTGDISDSDLMLAAASNAIVIGFNNNLNAAAQKSELLSQVDVRTYKVIYELIADIDKALKGLLEPVYEERATGKAEVRAVFKIPRRGKIAGCIVLDGEINRNFPLRVRRGSQIIHQGRINSLKRFQEDVAEVKTGFECGIGIDGYDDVQEGDIIEAYQKVRV
ncbi:MAG: translation initiation factor IF-2 [Caldilineales bacterium]